MDYTQDTIASAEVQEQPLQLVPEPLEPGTFRYCRFRECDVIVAEWTGTGWLGGHDWCSRHNTTMKRIDAVTL